MNLWHKIKRLVFGRAHNPNDPHLFHKLSLIALFAWIGLGADALSSSSYGPQEAFLALGGHTYLALLVALFTALTIFVISASYSQLIEVFPSGGGGYLVASKLLSPTLGMISGCALLIDYVLTIAISIASGADALFSFLPLGLQGYKLLFAVSCVIILIILNLRGVKESIMPLVPIFLLFVGTHLFAILYTIYDHFYNLPNLFATAAIDFHTATLEIGFFGVIFLILHAYSLGAGTYTGIEAVSNGMSTLREPRVQTAKRTMRYMSISLAVVVIGLMFAYLFYSVNIESGKTLNAVLFEKMSQKWSYGRYFIFSALIAEALLLFVAAQTGFLGGPRVLANMAIDRWFPLSFSALSDRLVMMKGIIIMGLAAISVLIFTSGSVGFLVVLYSITVFITFLLSQFGMVRYWLSARHKVRDWKKKLAVNGIGLFLTMVILLSVVTLKFHEGGWITLLITMTLITVAVLIKNHYNRVLTKIKKLDILVNISKTHSAKNFFRITANGNMNFNPNAKTAVILVNGYNGMGLEAISTIFRLFGNTFKNFVFVYIGVVDAGVFKGADEIHNLREDVKEEAEKYVRFMQERRYHAESVTEIGIDVVDEVMKLAPKIRRRYPNSVFFGGQIILPKDSVFHKMLHNYTVFALEKRLFKHGIPFIIVPIKV